VIRKQAIVYRNEKIGPGIYSMWLKCPQIAKIAKPGQFVQVAVNDSYETFLCRPLSIADKTDNKIRIIYRVIGKGTEILKAKKDGETLSVLGPLGKAITPVKNKNIVLCAGGLGIAPLLFLAKNLRKSNNLILFYGARNESELILLKEFKPLCDKIFLSTDDGSKGKKGVITDILFPAQDILANAYCLYIAGPSAMIKKISNYKFNISNLKLFAFLEERMGCGCGICFGCAVKKKGNGYLRVCTDGPVFDLFQIEL
jgi:dihydroorotate dehydrogenase electron transfer subunit